MCAYLVEDEHLSSEALKVLESRIADKRKPVRRMSLGEVAIDILPRIEATEQERALERLGRFLDELLASVEKARDFVERQRFREERQWPATQSSGACP